MTYRRQPVITLSVFRTQVWAGFVGQFEEAEQGTGGSVASRHLLPSASEQYWPVGHSLVAQSSGEASAQRPAKGVDAPQLTVMDPGLVVWTVGAAGVCGRE